MQVDAAGQALLHLLAQVIDQHLAPEKLFLVDAWSSQAFDDYRLNNQHRPWVNDLDSFTYYFGGPVSEQATMDRLHAKAVDRFQHKSHATILKSPTLPAREHLGALLGDRKLDYIYVDASHQYESVLDDLMFYDSLLGKLCVWAPDRPRAIARLRRALHETSVTGIPTTLPLLNDIAHDAPFVEGRYTTAYLVEREAHLPSLRPERVA